MTALAQQLVSVAIEADSVFYQLYSGGDMQSGLTLDVQVVAQQPGFAQ